MTEGTVGRLECKLDRFGIAELVPLGLEGFELGAECCSSDLAESTCFRPSGLGTCEIPMLLGEASVAQVGSAFSSSGEGMVAQAGARIVGSSVASDPWLKYAWLDERPATTILLPDVSASSLE